MSQRPPYPRPRYLRPLPPGVRDRTAPRNGHAPSRARVATKQDTEERPALFRTHAEMLGALAAWLVVLMALTALSALSILALLWAGHHLVDWTLGLLGGGRR